MEGIAVSATVLPSEKHKLTYGEILDEYCAFYMSIGVPCDEFWNGDYTRLKHYVRAYEMKHERETEEKNFFAWWQGMYEYNALTSVISSYMWWKAGKKGKQPEGYMQKPIPLTDREKEADRDERVRKTIEWFRKGQGQR